MILDIARLLLFPALMAFAAASDLFTMTISNRVSLALVGGFFVLAVLSGMGLQDMVAHIGAGAAVLAVAFSCFALGWVGGGGAQGAAGGALWFGFAQPVGYFLFASLFCAGLARRRRRQGRRGGRAVVRLRAPARLFALRLAVRRRADLGLAAVPAMAAAVVAGRTGLAGQAACRGYRHPLRDSARDRRAD